MIGHMTLYDQQRNGDIGEHSIVTAGGFMPNFTNRHFEVDALMIRSESQLYSSSFQSRCFPRSDPTPVSDPRLIWYAAFEVAEQIGISKET